MRLLSLLDQMFVKMESDRTPMHIGALAIFRLPEGADPEFVRDIHTAFSQMAYLPFPFDSVLAPLAGADAMAWQQVAPDPEHHVRLSALPSPGSEAELGRLVERLHSNALDMTRPLWEAHVIEGLADDRFAFYFKAHHAATDGLGAVNTIKAWLTTDPEALPGTGLSDGREIDPSIVKRLLIPARRAADGIGAVKELVTRIVDMARDSNSSVRVTIKTPRTIFNQRLTRHRRFATQVLELPRLKAVAQATDTTVNDVVLACVGGAVRRYLLEQDALPSASLTASVPFGFDRDEETVNAAAGFVCPLGTDAEDPLERLRIVNASTQRGKRDIESLSANAAEYYTLLGLVPLLLAQRTGVLQKLPPLFNFTVSNVVLSKEPLYLLGAQLEYLAPISFLVDGYGLNVTLVGYTDKVTLGVVGCRDTIPHLQTLAVHIGEALDELEAHSTSGG
jgi:diacylglycerol O-acyltransferase